MVRCSDYTNNGTCRFENFPECLNNPVEMELGSAGGVRWFMKLSKIPNDTHFAPTIYFKSSNRHFQVKVAIRYEVWHWKYETMSKKETMNRSDRFTGLPIEIIDIPRAVTVNYGIHVESTKTEKGIWEFNFDERHMDFKKNLDGLTIKFDNSYSNHKTLHCPKQLLKFHSSVVSQCISLKPACLSSQTINMDRSVSFSTLEKCLQIAYGVRPRLSPVDCDHLIIIAEKLNLHNVIRYIEQEMIQQRYPPSLMSCKCRNLKRYMANFLKRQDSFRKFEEICREWSVSELRSEIVKMILDKFMEIEF